MTDSDEVKLLPWPLFGYAPGTYISQCYRCNRRFENADKRAITCLECAVVQAKSHITDLESRPPVVTDEVVERAVAWALYVHFEGREPVQQPSGDWLVAARAALASMPAVVSGLQSTGDHALPPSGLSQSSLSQSETAAAIAREK